MLETHKNDPKGYSLLFVDPIHRGNFSSRLSHSCDPNCGTVTTISNGNYIIAMYALKDITFGEELTFDYCSYTEDLNECRKAICLCGARNCRGSYLEFAKSKSNGKSLEGLQPIIKRIKLVLQCGMMEGISEKGKEFLEEYHIKENVLESDYLCFFHFQLIFFHFQLSFFHFLLCFFHFLLIFSYFHSVFLFFIEVFHYFINDFSSHFFIYLIDCPKWLVIWISLILGFIDEEKKAFLANASQEDQVIFASNNAENRLQNLVISVDKIKYFLLRNSLENSNETPPLKLLKKTEIFEVLWGKIPSKLFSMNFSIRRKKPKSLIEDLLFTLFSVRNYPEINSLIKLIIAINFELQKTAKKDIKKALLIIRVFCLKTSFLLRFLSQKTQENVNSDEKSFNFRALADMLFFQAFTHCFFKAFKYSEVKSEPVIVRKCEVSNQKIYRENRENDLRNDGFMLYEEEKVYKSSFVWGQMIYWFKQMNNPEKALAAEKRGIIVYPNYFESFSNNRLGYPFNLNYSKVF